MCPPLMCTWHATGGRTDGPQPCAAHRWDQCFIRLLDGMLQVVGFAGACDGDFALRIPVRIRGISITEPGGSALSVLPCNVQRVLGATPFTLDLH